LRTEEDAIKNELLVNYLWEGSAGGDVTAEAAEGFAGDAQVGGDHVLGYALDAFGIGFHEFEIFPFGCFAEGFHEAALGGDEVILYKDAEIAFEGGKLLQQGFPGGAGDQEQFAVFQGFDVEERGFFGEKAVEVGCPPAFEGKLEDMLIAFIIDGV
jgi:hypothetical protein